MGVGVGRAEAGSAGELAWRLGGLCRAGIDARASGWCVGELLSTEIAIVARRGVARAIRVDAGGERYRRARRRAHEQCGHDAACAALGVPRGTLRRVLAAWDAVGAGALMEEALEEAIEGIADAAVTQRVGWRREDALEAVAHAVGRRITPLPPARSASGPVRSGGAGRGTERGRAVPVERTRPRLLAEMLRIAARGRDRPRTDRPRGAASPE
ncbi:hypothetical protein [Leucobacter chromiisoli]|uniref:hypothetical protein n=1 Tax=Leucobacter chromiisoli TaxID=2796471 RepID=UPI0019038153|nr:hypothetical protein [Leucobacter chromiisoli]